ncbi:energy-coupling factor ABC transporter ATP-binding protein [Oceanirhabdus sp. W0125-5]|uniref:energy-coupling factor ABC transporter ATP-binding protein n=1 Tax=Oceanirhabdus sp. W0125-5 TaxID=2999116 RepID=UPI0022F2D6DC|nr:ATP-binding cassette domain-containing protein [Oceanirhabdus sp. W0125-5]WBW98444.1 ATP-binding cassette domain-containing protein [Oceanirhabdus sp. W0125-5]
MINIEGLCYTYEDGTEALKNQSFDFSKGNIIAIIGANGAGKSTLFLNIMGIIKPTKGKIMFDGEELKYNKKALREYRKKIGIVFQDPDKQIFYSNVFDDVAFALRNIGVEESEINTRVNKALKEVDALEFKDKPVHFLSMGQKKRVAIAGTLAIDQDIILFDEPTAGLDPVMTEEIIKILFKLKAQGKKVIISSHNMDLIYRVSDYAYILSKGQIIREGKTEDAFLDGDALRKSGLNEPWLVKMHRNLNIPLFKKEEDFFEFMKKSDNG